MDGAFCNDRQMDPDQAPGNHNRDWYLVNLKPGGLARAQQNLSRQGIVSFCPQRRRTERRRGRMVTGLRPLFPGYLFISIPRDAANWRSINATYGVVKVVCLEPGRPSRVPTDLVNVLVASDASLDEDALPRGLFNLGDDVRVAVGPFADLLARVEAMPEKDRVLVLLDMMGRKVRVTMRAVDIERN